MLSSLRRDHWRLLSWSCCWRSVRSQERREGGLDSRSDSQAAAVQTRKAAPAGRGRSRRWSWGTPAGGMAALPEGPLSWRWSLQAGWEATSRKEDEGSTARGWLEEELREGPARARRMAAHGIGCLGSWLGHTVCLRLVWHLRKDSALPRSFSAEEPGPPTSLQLQRTSLGLRAFSPLPQALGLEHRGRQRSGGYQPLCAGQ